MAGQTKADRSSSCCGPSSSKTESISSSRHSFREFQVRAANDSDREAVSALLSVSNLAKLDSHSQFGPQYVVSYDTNGQLAGVAGLEIYGTDALLRSVAI